MNTILIFLTTWLMTLKSATTWYGMEIWSVWHEFVERINHRSVCGQYTVIRLQEMRGEKTKILGIQTKTRTRNPEYEKEKRVAAICTLSFRSMYRYVSLNDKHTV